MPFISYGTWKINEEKAYDYVLKALQVGYRYIDTAQLYKNEEQIGKAIKNSNIKRENIFLITKIHIKNIKKGEKVMEESVIESLRKLDTYIDLLLLHSYHDDNSWLYLENIYLKYRDKIKHIGVSNYNEEKIKKLLNICNIKPYTNQIEISPYFYRESLINLCQNNDILVIAHTIFSQNKINYEIYDENIALNNICKKYNKNYYQIIIKFLLQQNISIIIGTQDIKHIISNLDINFELDNYDIDIIKNINSNFILFKHHI
jgi:diketogulonate reductase-like aldo/keto reductase